VAGFSRREPHPVGLAG
jgi:hypothetical protein